MRANLPVWNKLRAVWHEKESKCEGSCACRTQPWFRSISSSEQSLHEGLLCKPVACPELMLEDDRGMVPKFHKPECTNGECT